MIPKILSTIKPKCRFSYPKRMPNEPIVRNGLAVTPHQMLEMASHGVAVSAGNSSQFYDGSDNAKFSDLRMNDFRGIDVATLWEFSRDVKTKASDAFKRNKQLSKQLNNSQ